MPVEKINHSIQELHNAKVGLLKLVEKQKKSMAPPADLDSYWTFTPMAND